MGSCNKWDNCEGPSEEMETKRKNAGPNSKPENGAIGNTQSLSPSLWVGFFFVCVFHSKPCDSNSCQTNSTTETRAIAFSLSLSLSLSLCGLVYSCSVPMRDTLDTSAH